MEGLNDRAFPRFMERTRRSRSRVTFTNSQESANIRIIHGLAISPPVVGGRVLQRAPVIKSIPRYLRIHNLKPHAGTLNYRALFARRAFNDVAPFILRNTSRRDLNYTQARVRRRKKERRGKKGIGRGKKDRAK